VSELQQDAKPLRWLLFIYKVPQEPPGRRTYVWRAMRQMGAIYLQQAAAILPHRPELHDALTRLAAQVLDFGGEVSVLETVSPDAGWQQRLVEQFLQARSREYAEVMENLERFQAEIRKETQMGKFTFAELEDLESDWEKLQRWRERVERRDFFNAPSRQEVVEASEQARTALEGFSATVYASEGVEAAGQDIQA